MTYRIHALLTLAILPFIFTSCKPRPKAPVVSNGEVVAKVGDTVITDKILLERIAQIEKSFPRVYSAHEQKKKLLEEMMNIELLYQAALRMGLDQRYEFKSRLADLYVQKLAEDARSQITDAEVKKYFDENRNEFEQVSAKHILLKTTPDMKAAKKKELKDKLEGIRKELEKDPNQFGDYATKYSEDGSATSKGELGFFTRKMMVKPFSDAAFNLKKIGDISPIVETGFGYHLIQLTGDRRNFEAYKDEIKDHLLRSSQRARLDAELEKLKKGKNLEIYEDNLAKLSPLPKEVETDPNKLLPGSK